MEWHAIGRAPGLLIVAEATAWSRLIACGARGEGVRSMTLTDTVASRHRGFFLSSLLLGLIEMAFEDDL